jgi:LacI family transcriptional regulator
MNDEARRSVTLKDVARAAETSVASVSHAINGTRFVSEETKSRVFAAINQLGYTGHSIARSLRRGRTATLGLVLSDIENPFFTKLANEAQRAASESGYQVIFANSGESREREAETVRSLVSQRVDGIILAPVARETVEWVLTRRIPFTLVNRRFDGIDAPHVVVDDVAGAQLGIDHLWDLGHRTIGIIRGDLDRSTTIDRLTGVREAYRRRGAELDERLVINAGRSGDNGERGLVQLMAIEPRPTAIFALSNWALIAALRGLQRTGGRCPEDVSLIGYGVTSPYWMPASSVTMIEQPVAAMAEASVRLLIDELEGGVRGAPVVVAPRLVPGRSSVLRRARK